MSILDAAFVSHPLAFHHARETICGGSFEEFARLRRQESAGLLYAYFPPSPPAIDKAPSGTVIAIVDFVGPRRALDDGEMTIANRMLSCMPGAGAPITRRDLAPLYDFGDSYENDRLEGVLRDTCSAVETIDLGGTISYPIWRLATSHLDMDREENVSIALLLQVMEMEFIRKRLLSSHVKLFVAVK